MKELSDEELATYEYAVELSGFNSGITDFINLSANLDGFSLLPDIHIECDLGYYWIHGVGCYDLKCMGNLANYIDYESFGRDVNLENNYKFVLEGYFMK